MSERLNLWRSLTYHDPVYILREYRKVELTLPPNVDPRVARLRTTDLKREREGRDAALFTYGMSLASGKKIGFAIHEAEDYDFITAWVENGIVNFTPVQLKELVPADLNPNASLELLLKGLASKYSQPTSTVLAIYLNRRARLQELLEVQLPTLGFSEIWYFCSVSSDASRFGLFGDAKSELKELYFEYPV